MRDRVRAYHFVSANGDDVLKTGFAFCLAGAIAKIALPTGSFRFSILAVRIGVCRRRRAEVLFKLAEVRPTPCQCSV